MPQADAIREYVLTLPRVDTHAHLEDKFGSLWEEAQGYAEIRTTAQLAGSRIAAVGCRELYGIDPGAYLRPDAPAELFAAAAQLRAQGAGPALEYSLNKAGITRQFAFTGQLSFQPHVPRNCLLRALSPRISLLAYLDAYITGDDYAFTPDKTDQRFNFYDSLCRLLGPLANLDAYLDALDREIDSWRQDGVLGMKIGLAYTTGLAFSDPAPAEARAAFARKAAMTPADIHLTQDFAVRHALDACIRNNFPVVIHTGFLIWGHGDLRQSNPILLQNLLTDPRYGALTFVLLHGGNPYIGETAYLAGMFSNVIIDFTWISWIDRTRFRRALAEWLELVPPTRFCWGSDSGTPESIVGVNAVVREEIAHVLLDLMERGILDARAAREFVDNAYQVTPARVFGL